MGFSIKNFFSKKEQHPNPDAELKILAVLGGIELAMSKVENLMRVGDSVGANQYLSAYCAAIIGIRDREEAFQALIKIYSLSKKQCRYDLQMKIIDALKENPLYKEDKYKSLVNHLLDMDDKGNDGVESGSNKYVYYICTNCCCIKPYLASPCTDCGFIPKDAGDVSLGIFMSSQGIGASSLHTVAGELKRGRALNKIISSFESTYAQFSNREDVRIAINDILLSINSKKVVTKPMNNAICTCQKCGKQSQLFSTLLLCHHCGTSIELPELKEYKLCLSDVLFLLCQLNPTDTNALPELIYKLCLLKAEAKENSHIVMRSEGGDIIDLFNSLGRLESTDGSVELNFHDDNVETNIIDVVLHPTSKSALILSQMQPLIMKLFKYCKSRDLSN